ncbi:MAG: glycosyltransferase family 2 protein [bacterium]|nr:glycosyltransferase family 2 protein [bacterium]
MSTITIVTPSFNSGQFIRTTLDSILSQQGADFECLVMDGGSQDGTVAILESITDSRLKWMSEPDRGQSHAINKGMQQAQGEILAYLNADDVYLPGTLRFVAAYFDQHPDADVVHGNCLRIDAHGKEMPPPLKGDQYTLKSAFIKRWHIPQPAVFWRRRVMERIGLFDERLHYTMDYDYWLRMLIAGFQPRYVDRDLAAFRFHQASKTVSQSIKFWENWQLVLEKIYSQPDLPAEIAVFKPLSYAYIDLYGAEIFWQEGNRPGARPFLSRLLRRNAPFRLKTYAGMMLVDSYLKTSLSKRLHNLNRTMQSKSAYVDPV